MTAVREPVSHPRFYALQTLISTDHDDEQRMAHLCDEIDSCQFLTAVETLHLYRMLARSMLGMSA